MDARYHDVQAAAGDHDPFVTLRFRLENCTRAPWHSRLGFHLGSQVYDPETATFITEGEWSPIDVELSPGQTQPFEVKLSIPPQDGPYRVYVSPLHEKSGWFYPRGTPFIIVDAVVEHGRTRIEDARVTTVGALRRSALARGVPKLFSYPVRSIWTNWRLIRSMVRRDILARYRGSFGDVFWTVLNPLLIMSAYFFVFGVVLQTRFGQDNSRTGFALYFIAGYLPWLAISEAVGRAPSVILEYRNFVKKLVFPLETLPVNVTFSGLVTEAFGLLVFLAAVLILRHHLGVTALWIPALVIPQILFTVGLCWFLAALGAYVRDLGQIMTFVLTLWFFLTPICYSEAQLPHAAIRILSKNPLYVLVRGYRAIFLEGTPPDFGPLWKLWLVSIVVCLAGHAWFHKLRRSFADVI